MVKSSGKFGDMPKNGAPKGPSDVVGDRVRELRKRRGLSIEDVAERLAALGAPELTANALYSVEGGRRKGGVRTRKITVDELLALATALDVSPLALLLPAEPAEYAITEGRTAEVVLRVYDWFIGRAGQPFGDQDPSYGWDGIPAGLPEFLERRERHLAAERDTELNAWRKMALDAGRQARIEMGPTQQG